MIVLYSQNNLNIKGESRKQEKKDTKNHNMMKLLWFYRIGNLAHYIKHPFCFSFFFLASL